MSQMCSVGPVFLLSSTTNSLTWITENAFCLWKETGFGNCILTTTSFSSCLASSLPIKEVVVWAHNVGAKVLVDACQSVPHMPVDVQNLNADFLVASSHKVRVVYVCSEIH